ncbi:hypothetical protein Q8F55_007794 [Vanrija albida]|uniref:Major facilitator superfamily (MFS) profile domain-containing protein n=1 Tax=Vanrija albida TaxID=181172 RepID=A0ABR3PUU0_9TREE
MAAPPPADEHELLTGTAAAAAPKAADDPPPAPISPADNARVLRKIDMVLIPLTMGAYTLQYIDRSAMSYAAVFSFRRDLHLTPKEYQLLGSVYFFGYLVFEFPGSWLLQRLPISKLMGALVAVWGVLLMCMAAPRSFGGMAALRTLLGASESLVTPGFVLLFARFYARDEQPLRVGFWYCCNGLGSFTGALISYAMGHVHVRGLPNWAWIFLLNGMITVSFAAVFLLLCPESPATWAWLTPHERHVAVERVRGNKASLHDRTWKWGQVAEALLPWRDPQGWAYFVITLCITIPNGGVAVFLHLILQSYGYSAFKTILYGLPQAVMQVIFPLSGAYIARVVPHSRCYVMMGYMLPSIVGTVIQYRRAAPGALLFGYYIMGSYVAAYGIIFGAPGANVAGYTKKLVVGAMIFVAYAVGNIIGPHLFRATEDPPYRSGMLTCIICFSLAVPMSFALRCYYVRENRRRDARQAALGERYDPAEGDFSDRTDVENLGFRYAL